MPLEKNKEEFRSSSVGSEKAFWADYIFLLRPMILVPVWTFFLLGTYHGTSARGAAAAPGEITAGLFSFTSLLGAIYVINQISDKETDLKNNKLFLIPRKIISVNKAWVETAVLVAASYLTAALYLSTAFLLIITASLFLGLLYSLEPVRLKRRAFFDVAANAVGSGILNTMAGWAASEAPLTGLAVLIPYPFAVASVHVVTALADIEGDRGQGLATSGVVLGRRMGLLVSVLLMLAAVALSLLVKNETAFYATLLSLPFFLIPALEKGPGSRDSLILLPAKTSVIVFSVVAGILFRLYLPVLAAVVLLTRTYYKRRFGVSYPSLK